MKTNEGQKLDRRRPFSSQTNVSLKIFKERSPQQNIWATQT